ncbi:MAG: NlpC/P60 family protein [Chloroflexota bacterium]
MTSPRAAARYLLVLSLALGVLIGGAAPVAATEAPQTELQRVIAIAMAQRGDRWVFAATGPNSFDCSGLVTYAFREAGLLDRIGGKRRTVLGFYRWFNARGLADRSNPKPGDLIVWGRFQHIGIYLGDGMAISTILNPYGVKVHTVKWVPARVRAYLHVQLER